MSSSPDNDVKMSIRDDEIFYFLTSKVGTISSEEYTKLVTRLFALGFANEFKKSALVIDAVTANRSDNLNTLLSLGASIVDDNEVVSANGVNVLSAMRHPEVTKVILQSILSMPSDKFEVIKEFYTGKKYELRSFRVLYVDVECLHTRLARLFIRLGMLPPCNIPFMVMMECGRNGVYDDIYNKSFVNEAIALADKLAETNIQLARSLGALDNTNIAITNAFNQLSVMLGADGEPGCEKSLVTSTPATPAEQFDTAIAKLAAERIASRERLAATETELLDTKILLNDTQAELASTKAELAQAKLNNMSWSPATKLYIDNIQAELVVTQEELTDTKATLAVVRDDNMKLLENMKRELDNSKATIVRLRSILYTNTSHTV